MIDRTIRLRDGRTLAFAEFGVSEGVPVFYFHGTLGSRFEGLLLEAAAERHGIRLIAIDRPGHGLSSPQTARTFAGWAEDVRELADVLGLQQFGMIGLSGGGAHAACAGSVLGERLLRLGLVSASGPPEVEIGAGRGGVIRLGVWFVRHTTMHLRALAAFFGLLVRLFGERLFAGFSLVSTAGDGQALRTPSVQRGFSESWREGTRQGSQGPVLDLALQLLPWDMTPKAPPCPVDLWYGLSDRITPVQIGRYFRKVFPSATLHELPDEGHLLMTLHGEAILEPFAQAQPVRASA